jgi:ribose transport system permease protein
MLRRISSRRPWLLAAAVFIALSVVNAALQPTFLTVSVAASNLSAFLPLILLAIGQTYVILGSDIDLSNGGIVSLVNVAVVELIERFGQSGGSYAIGVAVGLAIGVLGGVLNGFCVAYLRFQPIVTTFATSVIFVGLALWVLPQAGGQVPPEFYNVYSGDTLAVPNVLIMLIAAMVLTTVIAHTRLYQALRAIGGNMQAAFYAGVPVARVRLAAYVFSGFFAALCGLALVGETASGDPLIGGALTLSSVTAVVLGGTSLSGCVGSVTGSILGGLILGLINNVIFFAHVPFEWQGLIQGAIILAALSGGVAMARRMR